MSGKFGNYVYQLIFGFCYSHWILNVGNTMLVKYSYHCLLNKGDVNWSIILRLDGDFEGWNKSYTWECIKWKFPVESWDWGIEKLRY